MAPPLFTPIRPHNPYTKLHYAANPDCTISAPTIQYQRWCGVSWGEARTTLVTHTDVGSIADQVKFIHAHIMASLHTDNEPRATHKRWPVHVTVVHRLVGDERQAMPPGNNTIYC